MSTTSHPVNTKFTATGTHWVDHTDPEEHGDLFAAFRAMKAAFFKPKQRTHELLRNDCLKICTQNVCGFKKTRRLKWLEALRHQATAKRADVIFLQETRVKSEREASELAAHWNRLWGLRQNTKGTAFFSIDESGAGGVAILINPKKLTSVTPVAQGQWTNRFMAIEGAECVCPTCTRQTHAESRMSTSASFTKSSATTPTSW